MSTYKLFPAAGGPVAHNSSESDVNLFWPTHILGSWGIKIQDLEGNETSGVCSQERKNKLKSNC